MVVIQTLFTSLTPLCRICWMVCSLTVTYEWFPVTCGKSWRVPHVGQEMLTLSGTPDFTPFGEFMISPIHYIYILLNLSVLKLYLQINNSGLLAWINLTALSRTYFIVTHCVTMLNNNPLTYLQITYASATDVKSSPMLYQYIGNKFGLFVWIIWLLCIKLMLLYNRWTFT